MNINKEIQVGLLSGLILLILDYVYLSSTKPYFNKVVKSIQGKGITVRYEGVIPCYILLIVGLNYFVLSNNHLADDQKVKHAFWLGVIIYGVFDTTCYAIFDNWTLKAVLLDTIWGGIVLSATTLLTLKFIK